MPTPLTTERTNVTAEGYDYGGKRYKKETRQDAQGNSYVVDVEVPMPVTTAPTTPTSTTEKTAAQIYDFGTEDPELASALAARAKSAKESSDTTIDEEAIRQKKLDEMQAEIDAVNTVYADKLRRAQVQGRGRLGSSTAIQGRRGLLGSDFGDAITKNVEDDNTDIENSIENEKQVKIQALLTQARTAADAEIASKRAAKEAGLDDYIKYLQEGKTRKDANTATVLQALIANGLDPSTMDKASIDAIAKGYGLKTADVVNAYKLQAYNTKKAKDEADAKRKQDIEDELAKKGVQTIGDGAMGYRYNPTTKQYELVANNPKDYAPKAGGGTPGVNGVSPEAQAWADLIIDGKATIQNVPSAFRTQVATALNQTKATENGLAQGMYDAITSLENHPGMKHAVGSNALLGFGKGIAGTRSASFLKELETLKANLKLVNIKYLKGTGAISDAEGRTLEAASTSLDPSLSEADFKEELERVKAILLKTRSAEINQNPDYAKDDNQPKQVIYEGKLYNVDANGDMTPAN